MGGVPPLRGRLLRNMGYIVAGRSWYLLIWIVLTPYILDRLGAERFGVWSLLFLLSGYLATLDLGLGASVVKFTAEHTARADWGPLRALLSGINRIYVLLGALWIAVIVAAHPWLLQWLKISPPHVQEVRFALLASAAIFAFANLVSTGPGVLTGLQRMDLANGILVAASLPQLAVLIVGLQRGLGLYAVVASSATQWLATAILTWLALHRQAPALRWPAFGVRAQGGSWLRFSSVMQANNLIALTQLQLDKPILTTLQGLRAVAEFELGFRVASGIQSLPALILVPLMPAFAELHAGGQVERFLRLCRRASHWISAGALGLGAAFIPVAPLLVRAWIGPGHRAAEVLAAWLLAGFALNLTTGAASAAARGAGRPGLEVGPGLLGVAVHLGGSCVLVTRFGPAGAGPAFCLAMAVCSSVYLWRFAAWMRVPVGEFLLTVLARASAAFLPGAAVGYWLIGWMPGEWLTSRLGLVLAAMTSWVGAAVTFAAVWWLLGRLPRGPFREPGVAARGDAETAPAA